MAEELYNKHRPKKLSEVVGQDSIIKVLKDEVEQNTHAYIFTGGSGTGKTTISRIIANMLSASLIEVDAATHTSVDDARDIAETLIYPSFETGKNNKFVIIDEAHMLSKSAWNSWLKLIEEPPEHLYFSFCTTDFDKIPETIVGRCHSFKLKEIDDDSLYGLLENIVEKEKIEISKKALALIIEESKGSARQALVYLSQIKNANKEDIETIISSGAAQHEVIELCRMIVKGEKNINKLMLILNSIKNINAESIRIAVARYITVCILKSKTEKEVLRFAKMLESFEKPMMSQTGFSSLVLASLDAYFN